MKSISKDRMSRRQPRNSRPGRRVEDPKEAYTTEQLAEVGAIAIIWNQIENFLDFLLLVSLKTDIIIHWEVARRISGSIAKTDILRIYAERANLLNDDARKCIKYTLDGVLDYKRYRDNIIHSVPYDIDKGIAHTFKRHTDIVQTLVTVGALKGLYSRMKLILDELREIDLLYRLADEDGARAVYPDELDPLERRRTRDVPLQTERAVQVQKARKSLPPLPRFPDEGEAAQ